MWIKLWYTLHRWSFCFSTSFCWIHCIDQSKTFNLLIKSKIETLSHVHVYRIEYVSYRQGPYRIGKVRIEYVSYRQGPYRIRIVSAKSVSNTYCIGKVRIEYVSYRQGPYRIRIVSAADCTTPALIKKQQFSC